MKQCLQSLVFVGQARSLDDKESEHSSGSQVLDHKTSLQVSGSGPSCLRHSVVVLLTQGVNDAGSKLRRDCQRLQVKQHRLSWTSKSLWRLGLGGHLKTGQSWTGQTRPVSEHPKHECSTPFPPERARTPGGRVILTAPGADGGRVFGGCHGMAPPEIVAPEPNAALAVRRAALHDAP